MDVPLMKFRVYAITAHLPLGVDSDGNFIELESVSNFPSQWARSKVTSGKYANKDDRVEQMTLKLLPTGSKCDKEAKEGEERGREILKESSRRKCVIKQRD
jgi:hypothetical protein